MRYVKGNLLLLATMNAFEAIGHQTNCQNTWGRGIAVDIKNAYPAAYDADMSTTKGDSSKLGTISFAVSPCNPSNQDSDSIHVFNLYGQDRYGKGKHTDEDMLIQSFHHMKSVLVKAGLDGCRIGFPILGGGRGQGDVDKILEAIKSIFTGFDVTIVEFDGNDRHKVTLTGNQKRRYFTRL